jgi:hypothetical protein
MPLYRVHTEFTGLAGAPYLNTLFFDELGGSSQNAANAVANFWGAVDAGLDSNLDWATLGEVATLNEVNGDILSITNVTTGSGSGAVAGEVSPTVLQALISWSTGVPFDGRILRGRTFIPGIPEAALSDGVLQPSSVTLFQNAATALIGELNAQLSIWHRPIPPPDEENPDRVQRDGAQADVGTAVVRNGFAVLRSRRD